MNDETSLADAELNATAAWSKRVRCIGGLVQAAVAGFWLARAVLNVQGNIGFALAGFCVVAALAVFGYGVRFTDVRAPRPTSPEAKRIERAVTVATVVQLAASVVVPAIFIATDHVDWVLPSITITIGPLLLWLDHRLDIPRYRLVGYSFIAGPVVLAATMSGTPLEMTTGIATGGAFLIIAAAGFHDLAGSRAR